MEVKVIRDKKRVVIDIHDVVVGDIVSLETGNRIPADGVYISGNDFSTEESAVTGESDDKKKSCDTDPFLLSGSTAASGNCLMLVIAVGIRSMQGKIRQDTASEAEDTPLQKKLDVMATKIGYFGTAAAIGTFIALTVTWFATETNEGAADFFVEAFIIAVTIIVVAIPEGLPLAVTISLAYSTKKMLKDKNLIRVLAACETMGNATTICSDKTGTLTQNRMTVVEAWIASRMCTFDGAKLGDAPENNEDYKSLPGAEHLKELIVPHMALNTCATFVDDNVGLPKVTGSKTEGALILLLRVWGFDYSALRQDARASVFKQYPFSSELKMMSTLVRLADGTLRLYVTGGSDVILARCTGLMDETGNCGNMSDNDREALLETIEGMASKALRTVALAYCDFASEDDLPEGWEEAAPANDMNLYTIVGIKDPLRAEVNDAVATCIRAGILVRMVTGDNVTTARAIARECGILTNGTTIEGPDFRRRTPKELDAVIRKLQVMARSSPRDKFTLVTRLNGIKLPHSREEWEAQHPNNDWEKDSELLLPGYFDEWKQSRVINGIVESDVVGVTGDGTNDAPALKAADVGLSMGIAGTEVAKEASDIVILDDNFASIVKAVLWGRSVYDNIRKFLQFQLTVNVVALLLTFISAVSQKEPPLNAVMMLWVNLIMDTLGALALGTEPPTEALLDRRPFTRNASLISRKMWRNILVQSAFQLALTLVFVFDGEDLLDVDAELLDKVGKSNTSDNRHEYVATFIFNAFVFCQLFNEVNARSIGDTVDVFSSIITNWMFVGVWFIEVGLQVFIIEVGGDFTKTTGLTAEHWGWSILLGLISFPLGT